MNICYLSGYWEQISSDTVLIKTKCGLGFSAIVLDHPECLPPHNTIIKLYLLQHQTDFLNLFYGFKTIERLLWFQDLIMIKNIGIQTAKNIINQLSFANFHKKIITKNYLDFLTLNIPRLNILTINYLFIYFYQKWKKPKPPIISPLLYHSLQELGYTKEDIVSVFKNNKKLQLNFNMSNIEMIIKKITVHEQTI